MRRLYHLWLSPASRAARLMLAEKRLEFELVVEKTWERRQGFLEINPAGEVPVLVEDDGTAIAGAIAEYLDEVYGASSMIGDDPLARAEVRRLTEWFAVKFAREVSDCLVGEKVMKRFLGAGQPDSAAIRAGLANIHIHLDYVSFLVERRNWLAGDDFSLADIAAGSHLSTVDYIGNVPWDDHPEARAWYARLKSRPSFRPLLADAVPGLAPAAHYADLDF